VLIMVASTLSLLAPFGNREQGQASPIPTEPEQVQAERMIRELYQADFAKKTPYSLTMFAKRLLTQAKETRDDPALRYVLYRDAADLAAQIGNPSVALGAINAMAKDYQLDASAATQALLAKMLPNITKPADFRELCEAYLRLVDDYKESDQFGPAGRAARGALLAAGKSNDPSLLGFVQETANELSAFASDFEKAEQAEKTLAASPGDPAANQDLGEYLCLNKTMWDKGLPFLAKASGRGLGALASRDLSHSSDAKEQVELGDGWWSLAEKEARSLRKSALFERAGSWYRRAQPNQDGPSGERIRSRLGELERMQEPPTLGLVGRWSFEEGEGVRARDSSGKDNHGTLEKGVRWGEGFVGKGVNFDGKESYLALGATGIPAPEAPQTVFWAHKNDSNPRRSESIVVLSDVASQVNLTAGLREDKVVVWKWGGVPLVLTPSPSPGEWHTYAYSFDGTVHKLYADGFLKDESTTPCQKGSYSKLEIGRWFGNDARGPFSFFRGCVDEVRIYARALSDGEIRLLARRKRK
jgi:hypothetical protein